MQDIREIEDLILARNKVAARQKIRSYLKKTHSRSEALLQACEWYRRLALYREGFALVAPAGPLSRTASSRSATGRRILWAARFLNLMGSPELALPLLARVDLSSEEDFWIAGNIHLVNFEAASALRHFQAMEKRMANSTSYQSRLRLLGLADALAGTGRFTEAIQISERVSRESEEPLLLGIALQAKGEYLARSGKYSRALGLMLEAKKYFPTNENTTDSGFLFKWLGFAHGKCGNAEVATRFLTRSEKILRSLRMRPEAWLDVYRLRSELGVLEEPCLRRMSYYPGLCEGFRKLLPAQPAVIFGMERAELEIDLAANEFRVGRDRYCGLPKEILLLAWIRITEDWGLTAFKAKGLLWPTEPHAYLQMDARLAQLVYRLRHEHGLILELKDGTMILPVQARARVAVFAGGDARPGILRSGAKIVAEDLSRYYSISKTQRSFLLKNWEKRGWLQKKGSGPGTFYCPSRG